MAGDRDLGAVAALSFFWGSVVLGIVFRLASDDVQAWWVVLVLGPIPIVVLLAGTARCRARFYHAEPLVRLLLT